MLPLLGLASCLMVHRVLGAAIVNNFTSSFNFTTQLNQTLPGGPSPPIPPPSYMVDNTGNRHGSAPDRYVPALERPVASAPLNLNISRLKSRQDDSYWLANMAHGQAWYPVFRNVHDFGAKGDGVTDDTAAINAAITFGNRCGFGCGSTTVSGAIVYFPKGRYMVSAPLIQYYYTQFIGDPTGGQLPIIQGLANFAGIALIDTDVYIPGGNGAEWYINQNQFYRQIRNLEIDLTLMPNENTSGDQSFVPTGIHWQVAQSTSIQNVNIKMPIGGGTTAVGIFTENGSGGFMSDITFQGGNIGMRVGSQQFTARDLTFTLPATAVSMIWDWGWTWQNIYVNTAFVAFDCTSFGGPVNGQQAQGTGSLTVLDSHFSSVPFAIPVSNNARPAIVLDNLLVDGNTPAVVLVSGGDTILQGTTGAPVTITSWAMGRRYASTDDTGTSTAGNLNPVPNKPPSMLSSGKWFTRSKPQYENLSAGSFINVASFGAVGDAKTDSTAALNRAFQSANGAVVFIPAGIYMVSSTVLIPTGTRVVGELWPQIMGFGDTFSDGHNPVPVVQVGNVGDIGNIEISDLLFTVQGPSPGAIVVAWNVQAASQGSAGMWDSHVRVGGAFGSNLEFNQCPASSSFDASCSAAAMLMQMRASSSGYFENTWFWVADHDLDEASQRQINVFAGRGLLIETQGPTWFWGSASEHSALYQYHLFGASNVFFGHMQTESPYYQPTPDALNSFQGLGAYVTDPQFEDCYGNPDCLSSWALLVRNSSNVFIYGAGFYSWFSSYSQACLAGENCQQRLIQTDYSQGLWLYSLFTKGATDSVSPLGGVASVPQADNRNGFLTAISAWLPLALTGANIGGIVPGEDHNTPDGLAPVDNGNLTNACGKITCGETLTLTPACATAIASLPVSGANNNPPGPDNCGESCDIYRLLTGTCCGTGGSACFAVEIPPGQEVPAPFPITSGFPPPASVTFTVTGYDSAGTPTTTTYDSKHTPTVPVIIPPGFPPVPPLGPPLVVPPPVDLPDDEASFLILLEVFDDGDWPDFDSVGDDPPPTSTTTSAPPTSTPGGGGGGGPTSTIVIEPTGTQVACVSPSPTPGGTEMLSCLDIAVGPGAVDTSKSYCTNTDCVSSGPGYCWADPSSGGKCADDQSHDQGNGVIHVDNWCTLAQANGCAFVVALKGSGFGGTFPDSVCVTGAEISQFVRTAANQCGNGGATDVLALTFSPDSSGTSWCLADADNPGVCGA